MSNADTERFRIFRVENQYGNGRDIETYIPPNVTSDTKIILYEHGDGGLWSDWNTFKPYFENGQCQSIVIRADRFESTKLALQVAEEYGIASDNIIPVGYSGGGVQTCYTTADLATQSQNGHNLAILLEGSCPSSYLESLGHVNTYKENDTVFLYFESNRGYQQTQYAKAMAEMGVNVLVIRDTGSAGHGAINDSLFTAGLDEFIIGNGGLISDRYEIGYYNQATGEWTPVDPSTITNINDIYNLFGVEMGQTAEFINYTLDELSKLGDLELKSSMKDLEGYLNKIRGAIRSTSITTANIASSFSSTTMMPSQVPAVVNQYIASTTSFLSKLANETAQFALIGESIKSMDFNLERVAKELNDIKIVQAVYGESTGTDIPVDAAVESTTKTLEQQNMGDTQNNNVQEVNKVNTGAAGFTGSTDTTGSTGSSSSGSGSVSSGSSNNSSYQSGNIGNSDNSYTGNSSGTSVETQGNVESPSVTLPTDTSVSVEPPQATSPVESGESNVEVESSPSVDINEELAKFDTYEDVLSNDNRLVIESDDGYKIVVHKDGDTVAAIEHYYDFETSDNASNNIMFIKLQYGDKSYFQEVLQQGQYVKVIMKPEVYGTSSLEEISKIYSDLSGFKIV